MGGVRRYLTELWRAMSEAEPGVTGVAIGGNVNAALAAGLQHRPLTSTLPTNLGWAAWALPRAARRLGADVFHAPAYTAPIWGARPLVLTIHDVSYARRPEWYPHGSGALRQAFYRHSAKRANRIITDSAFSRDEIVAAYGLDAEKVTVIPLGVSDLFRPSPGQPREPVVLHVGASHPRRNLRLLIDVVARLRLSVPGLALVLVGAGRSEETPLTAYASSVGADGLLQFEHDTDDMGLCSWYQRATVLAYPSQYEGFGLPVIEAMACGTPVVAGLGSSLTEVVGDAGVLVDANDRVAWVRALRHVFERAEHAAALSAQGLARAAQYSWSNTAAQTAAVYRSVIPRR